MSIEIELKNLIEKNGFYKKKTKIGSAWTYDHKIYRTVNYHHNDTVSFNYLGKYMRDKVKEKRGTILDLSPEDKKILYRKELSNLPFFKKIENFFTFSLRARGGDYLIISHKVGISVYREIIKFIVEESGNAFEDI
jgi:predicted RNA binding protein YcfA (HicA-like mRNA interferase family)